MNVRPTAAALAAVALIAAAGVSRAGSPPDNPHRLYVPGAAHVAGAAGTNWRTDLEVHNPGDLLVSYTLELLVRDQENSAPQSVDFNLSPRMSARYSDVLDGVFGLSGAGTVRVSPAVGELVVTAKTYNDQPDGTYGQFIQGVREEFAVDPEHNGRLIQLSRSADGRTGFRTNLGVVSVVGTLVEVDVRLYDAAETLLGTLSYPLRAYESIQVNDVFGNVTADDVEDGYAVVTTTTPGGRFLAYASVVDNRTGDPLYIPASVISGGAPGPGEVTVYLPGELPLVLVRIPAGTFQMGSPPSEQGRELNERLHEVTLTRDYYVGKFEVTQEQWQAVTGSNPSHFTHCGDTCPVENMSWDDVAGPGGFLDLLNRHLQATGQTGAGTIRLPTEAEWERAARAGTQTRFAHGDVLECDEATQCLPCAAHAEHMWWCGTQIWTTHPVGQKLPNGYGLYDIHGNVAEFVNDWDGYYPDAPVVDPTGPETGSRHEARGGSWGMTAEGCRSAQRNLGIDSGDIGLGFRVAGTP